MNDGAMTTRAGDPSRSETVRSSGRVRLQVRLSEDVKALIERAANLEGRSLSDFVVQSAHQAALETIERHEVIRLPAEESRRLAELLLDPPEPNEALREAAARHARLIESR